MANTCARCGGRGCIYCKWGAAWRTRNEGGRMAWFDRIRWQLRMVLLALKIKPAIGADDGTADEGAGNASDDDVSVEGGDAAAADEDAADEGADEDGSGEPDWKSESRKHERRAKQSERRAKELEQKLKEREDADKSEQEKAIEKAREEARSEALSEAEKERRTARLEVAVTRLAAKGLTVGEGEDAKSVKFADPDDAQVYVDRAIAAGDIDTDEIYDEEGKVQTDALTKALAEILSAKPHLQAGGERKAAVSGSADQARGTGGSRDLESMSIEEHLRDIQKTRA